MRQLRITVPRVVALACVGFAIVAALLAGASGALAGKPRPAHLRVSAVEATRSLVGIASRAVSKETAADPSGVTAPVGDLAGWRQIYLDNFSHPAPVGSFGGCVWRTTLPKAYCPHLPEADRKQLVSYSNGIVDTEGTGRYMASQVLSIQHGMLDFYLHSVGGHAAGAVIAPKIPDSPDGVGQLYGAYSIRFRASSIPGYHLVSMLWPDEYSEGAAWPADGELDFPEGDLDGSINGFSHFGSPAAPEQYVYQHLGSFSKWHTAVIEWTPDAVHYIMDGRVVATIKQHVPDTPMHFLLQAETGSSTYDPPASVHGHIQIAWISAYAPA